MSKLDYMTPEPQSEQEIAARLRRWENWIISGLICTPLGVVIIFIIFAMWWGESNF